MREVEPQSTSRALAFELWMKAPMPMVTLMKTLDVTPLVRLSRKRGYKFNMLLCWCIGKAAAEMEEQRLGAHPVERAPRAAKPAAALTAVAVTQYPDIRNADGLND